MENNNKKMFTGFSRVFNFTAVQNIKGAGFKLSTVLLAVILAVAFALISILQAVSQDEKETDDKNSSIDSVIELEDTFAIDIYYVNESSVSDEQISGIMAAEAFNKSTFTKVEEADREKAVKDTNAYLKDKETALVMRIMEDKENIIMEYYLPHNTKIEEETADILGTAFVDYIEFMKTYEIVELNGTHLELYNAGFSSHAHVSEAGSEAENIGVMIAKMFVPMLFTFGLYMMILLYGQSITKIVVAEKSSKLMETLLTSVKPYAIISGKILAISGLAVVQMIIWILAAVGGYIIGEHIAETINPDYINYVTVLIEIISSSSDAFSVGAVVVALLMMITGFLMFCVAAGLAAAMVDKLEDISSATSLFQIPVILGFIGAYFVPLMENTALKKVVTYLPVTSPFGVPADVIVGNISMAEAIVALLIVAVTTFVLIIFTGKVYKGKLFNRH